MQITTVSPKFQVVIPKNIRELFEVKPGNKVVFLPYKRTIRLVVVPTIEAARGMLKGMENDFVREADDRL